jgi:ADP-ribosylglycohydrolase
MEIYSLLSYVSPTSNAFRHDKMKTILILEDNPARVAAFQRTCDALGAGFELKVWRNVHAMRAECEKYFSTTVLISLDHDLTPLPGEKADPGTGLDAAKFLGDFLPVCPVILHSQNVEFIWSMHNELRFAGWTVYQAGSLGSDWSEKAWAKQAVQLLETDSNTWHASLPDDHLVRMGKVMLSLDGLGLGDALGEMLSYRSESAMRRIVANDLPAGPWFHTDDTEMAISIVATLKSHGSIDQNALAKRFARRFERDPERGYGRMTRIQMREIMEGAKWRETAANAFGGQGSKGNGGAMRAAPLGAYFSGDLDHLVSEAQASAMVTHTHMEGVAGTIAVALAAALALELGRNDAADKTKRFFEEILTRTPESQVRRGILFASQIPKDTIIADAARALGNGSLVTAPDTVPFALWVAAHYSHNFVEALGVAISGGGDCDTNAAIVGGIVALSVGRDGIPAEWLKAREIIQF